jgi:decaprenylphospho-beta-D-ribofuranose 2-oxidase
MVNLVAMKVGVIKLIMNKSTMIANVLAGLILVLFFCSLSFALSLNDNGHISETNVSHVVNISSETDILAAIQQAKKEHRHIAMMGKQHSQGGQSLSPQAIELDMLLFNKVLGINTYKKQVTVESGITWADLQKYINSYNLAIKSMQSPNIFTVGGSISVNAHGDDFRAGAVGKSIVAFHLLLANGQKVFVTPDKEPTLWSAVIGGYGLIGVITDVTLQLTDNDWLKSNYQETDIDRFPAFFREKVAGNKSAALFYAHLNIVPGDNFLQKMYVITYTDTHELPNKIITLDDPDKWNEVLTPIFNVSRHGELGKAWRWAMEKKIFRRLYNNRVVTRNNAMEKPVSFASNHQSQSDADWLQEYFIPLNQLPLFINALRNTMVDNNVNLLNVTIRYVPAEPNVLLSYARKDCFAVVLYFNQHLSAAEIKHTQSWTHKLIDASLSLNGNYYLPYQPFASLKQFRSGYPGVNEFLTIKQQYDTNGLFSSKFYQKYFLVTSKQAK